MSSAKVLRLKVLTAFKDLHKARLEVFRGDEKALEAGRNEINQHFRKNCQIQDPAIIEELIATARDSARILREHVVQIEQVGEHQYRANLSENTFKLDNTEYRDVSDEELLKRKPRKGAKSEDKPGKY